MNKTSLFALSSATLLCLSAGVQAAQIQGVTIAAVSSETAILNNSTPTLAGSTNLLNSTGLFGDIVTTIPGGTMWLTSSNVNNTAGTPFVTFNLGASHALDSIKVWNYNAPAASATNDGVKLANISYSTDNVNFTTNLANYAFTQAPGKYTNFAQVIPMGGVVAQYVRIDIITNFAAANAPVGLSKVRFVDTTVPPAVLSATENYNSNQVTVTFSESVDLATATNKANYTVQNATVLNAMMGEFDDRVILQTSPLTNNNTSVTVSGVYDLALTAAVTNNSTAAIQPELVVWLKGDAGVSTDGSGNVTQWSDQSGYGHNASTYLAVNQYTQPPTLAAGAVNGLNAINFNGQQLMEIPNDPNQPLNGDLTICLVLDKTASALGDPISKTGGQGIPYTGTPLHGFTNNLPAPFDYQISAAQKSVWVWGNGGGGAPATLTSTGAFVINQYYIVSMVVHGTNSSWYLNGSFNGTTTLLEAPADGGNPIYLGVRSDSGNVADNGAQFTGNIAEIMILRGTVSPTDFSGINTYLGQKYNIPVVTLAITEQPQSTTAQVGQQATFWVGAVGVPPLTYQWKSNNVSITGATGLSYTTPRLTAAANAASYTVTVTSPVGTTNSSAAILTVTADTTAPTIFSATKTATNGSNILVVYSEPVGATALSTNNYSLAGGSVLSATYSGTGSNAVLLTTSGLSSNTPSFLSIQNAQDLFGNTLSATNVPVLPAAMSLWLRADSGVMLDTNGVVSQWLDQTVNTNNATQFAGGVAARPSLVSGLINGQPSLYFNGASDYLQAASTPSIALAGDMSVFVVANFTDYGAAREILGKTQGAIPAPYDYYVQNASTLRFYRGNGTGNALEAASTAPSSGSPHVLGVTMQGTTVNHFLDGMGNGSGALVTNTADTGQPLRIGSRGDLSQFMSGTIAEVMIFSNAVSSNDMVSINNYLGVKYFPFSITSQPADVTTQQGVTATFTVAASQGSAQFSYQWLKNSSAIPGATNASYTTPLLSTSDSGEDFSVQIIVPGISTNLSSTAHLTVNNVAPVVVTAGTAIWNQSEIVVTFTEGVDPVTGANPNNYSLNPAATVLSAVVGDAPNKIILTTSTLAPGTAYSVTVSNVMDLYSNTVVAASTPVGVYPNTTALWLKADSGVTTDSFGVNQWNDFSGNGNNLTQPFGAPYAPQLVTNAINGNPAVRFNSTNETYMGVDSNPTLAITGDMAIYAVVSFDGLVSSTNGEIVSKVSGSIPAPYDYYARSTGVQFYRGNGTAFGLVTSTHAPAANVPHIMGVTMQGTAVVNRLDGATNGTGTISTTIADAGQPLYIGTRGDGNNRLNGDLAELIIIGGPLALDDRAALENYLGVKYGILLGPVPSLSVALSGTNVVISFATPTAPFLLESTPVLPAAAWTTITNVVAGTNGFSTATLPANATQMYYRLQKQ